MPDAFVISCCSSVKLFVHENHVQESLYQMQFGNEKKRQRFYKGIQKENKFKGKIYTAFKSKHTESNTTNRNLQNLLLTRLRHKKQKICLDSDCSTICLKRLCTVVNTDCGVLKLQIGRPPVVQPIRFPFVIRGDGLDNSLVAGKRKQLSTNKLVRSVPKIFFYSHIVVQTAAASQDPQIKIQ